MLFKIKGNIEGENSPEERLLNVVNKVDGGDVVVGNNNRKELFIIKNHESNSRSFQLDGFDLFIGFDQDNNTLKLTSELKIWEVNSLEGDVNEVCTTVNNEKKCWEMNSITLDSIIRLSTNLSAPRPPKQKWKFVRPNRFDKMLRTLRRIFGSG